MLEELKDLRHITKTSKPNLRKLKYIVIWIC